MLDSIKNNQTEKYFNTMLTRRNKQINVINQARDLIIRSNTKDMLYVISTIKKSIEGEDATLQALVQAEAASKAKLFKQAEGYLKAHKKTLKDEIPCAKKDVMLHFNKYRKRLLCYNPSIESLHDFIELYDTLDEEKILKNQEKFDKYNDHKEYMRGIWI